MGAVRYSFLASARGLFNVAQRVILSKSFGKKSGQLARSEGTRKYNHLQPSLQTSTLKSPSICPAFSLSPLSLIAKPRR